MERAGLVAWSSVHGLACLIAQGIIQDPATIGRAKSYVLVGVRASLGVAG